MLNILLIFSLLVVPRSTWDWDGYIQYGHYRTVEGTFTIPRLPPIQDCGTIYRVAEFVGFGDTPVAQAGMSASSCRSTDSRVGYYAWVEDWPQSEVPLFSVRAVPGQTFHVSIRLRHGWMDYTMELPHHTYGGSLILPYTPTPTREWVVEMASSWYNYGRVRVSGVYCPCQPLIEDQGGGYQASPSPLHGQSYWTRW